MAKKNSRLYFIDHLRIYLIILVVLQHIAATYAGVEEGWYYVEGHPDMLTSMVLLIFIGINGSFFMAFFFMISSYFISDSYDRKGPRRFLRDRLLRLGIPLLLYIIIIDPLINYVIAVKAENFDQSFKEYMTFYIENLNGPGVGPLWFVETLLIFTFIYMMCRLFISPQKNYSQKEDKLPSNLIISVFAFSLGIIAFIVRIRFPLIWRFEPLDLEFAKLPQYISFFIIGIVAHKNNWFFKISDSMTKIWLPAIGIITVLMLIIFLSGEKDISSFMGGMHWQSFIFALWEHSFSIGIIICLLARFRNSFNQRRDLLKAMSDSTYTVYIIHAPILVIITLSLRNISLPPLIKCVVISPVVVFLCFLIGNYARKLPVARNIL